MLIGGSTDSGKTILLKANTLYHISLSRQDCCFAYKYFKMLAVKYSSAKNDTSYSQPITSIEINDQI